MAHNYLAIPDNKGLVVRGTGMSPQVSRSPSPADSCFSDSETERSEEYTVLDGVNEINEMLLKQIQAIRRQIDISEKTYNEEKANLLAIKDAELRQKDNEINKLTSSSHHKDENILQLQRIAAEKDNLIQVKSLEIDNLKNMIKQIQDKAHKIQEKVKRALRKSSGRLADDNTVGSPRNEETAKLRVEIGELKARLATLQEELARAVKVIEDQNEQMRIMGQERKQLEVKLAEKLNKASESMSREVERTCQVLLSNIDEITQLKQQNKNICTELSSINNHLKILVERGVIKPQDNAEDLTVDKASEKPVNKEPIVSKSTERLRGLDLKPTPMLQHKENQFFTPSRSKIPKELRSSYNARQTRPHHTHVSGPDRATRPVFQSQDAAPRRADPIQTYTSTNGLSVQTLDPPVGDKINRRNVIPPIPQKVKPGKPPLSARGGVRKDPKK